MFSIFFIVSVAFVLPRYVTFNLSPHNGATEIFKPDVLQLIQDTNSSRVEPFVQAPSPGSSHTDSLHPRMMRSPASANFGPNPLHYHDIFPVFIRNKPHRHLGDDTLFYPPEADVFWASNETSPVSRDLYLLPNAKSYFDSFVGKGSKSLSRANPVGRQPIKNSLETAGINDVDGRRDDFMISTRSVQLDYSLGDISPEYAYCLQPTSIHQFNGVWRLILPRSDSIEEILQALEISLLKRRVMASFAGSTTISVATDGQSVYMRNSLPMGRTVAGVVPLNGSPFQFNEPDTGLWTTRAIFTKNRLIQIRQSHLGRMYDVRVVFETDPHQQYVGPLLLFKWTFISATTNFEYSANRWLYYTPLPTSFES